MPESIDPVREKLISLDEAAGMIPVGVGKTVSVKTLRRWVSDGRLQAIRVGDRIVLTSREAVFRMLLGKTDAPAAQAPSMAADTARQKLAMAGVRSRRGTETNS